MLNYSEYLLNDREIERVVLNQVFDKRKVDPDNFYRTGWEYIPFTKDRIFALETILTSVVGFGKEVLIFDFGRESILPVEICMQNDIVYRIVKVSNNKPDIEQLQKVIKTNSAISYACISLTNETVHTFDLLNTISILNSNNIETIIDFNGDVSKLAGLDINSFHFIASCSGVSNVSFIAALRSKLVQTEGNARSYAKDLHAFWQQSLRNRKREIEPLFL